MAEVYTARRGPIGATRAARGYFGLVSLAGASLATGAAYWTGLAIETLRETASQIPYMVQNPNFTEIYQTVSKAFENGKYQGADWAVLGGIAGLILTNKFKNAIGSFLRR